MFRRLLLITMILVSCVGCDQTTKSVATTYLSETQAVSLLGGSVRLQIAKNYGAFLSVGASMPQAARTTLLSVGVAAVLIALFAYCVASTPANSFVTPALAIVIGGGVSNLIDRLHYGGYVLDFLNLGIGSFRTGIFNIADVFITSGILLLVFSNRLRKLRPPTNASL
ncbi:MAG: signal peptidase II [Povalibacter sp.]